MAETGEDSPNRQGKGRLAALLHRFRRDEDGSSTVEMVVMMAAGAGIGVAVMGKVSDGIENLAGDIGDFLGSYRISTSFDDPPDPGAG